MAKVIPWRGMELVIKDFQHSHVNGGRLGKIWVEDQKSGRTFLVKSCRTFSCEPYSEKLAYLIGKSLGIDVLEYDILPAKYFQEYLSIWNPLCPYVSICEKIDRKGYSITSIAEIKRARNAILPEGATPITNREVMYELLPKSYIDTMLLFDAIIGNTDRHYGNVHLLRNKDGEMIGAPILDNGDSLLASVPFPVILAMWNNMGEFFNMSSTMERNHDKQMMTITSLGNVNFNIPVKTMEILDELEETFSLMPPYRVRAVKKYLIYRLHKYLGLLKFDNLEAFRHDKSKVVEQEDVREEIEHT